MAVSAIAGLHGTPVRLEPTTDLSTRTILSVARSVVGDLDLSAVLNHVLDAARKLTGARYAALGVLNEERTELAQFLTLGIDEDARREIGPLPKGRGVLGELIERPAPLRLADVGSHPRSYGFPVGHPPMRSFLGTPILIAGQPFGNLYLTDKQDGTDFSEADEEALVLLADFAGVAIDHARRYTGVEARRQELQQTVNALDATMQIARALGGETDLTTILELVAKRGRALVSARALVIELKREDELVVAAGAGELPSGLIGQRLGLQDTVAARAIATRKPQRISDELNRVRFEHHGLGRFGLQAGDALVVPLIFRDEAYGVMVAVGQLDKNQQFSDEQEQLLEAFAASAATAVATAESVATERLRQGVAAAEAERARWARELHDETLQGLASLRLGLGAARRAGDAETMGNAIGQAMEQLESDIANLRALITELRPAALDELGLASAITALAERMEGTGLNVDVSLDLAHEAGRTPNRLTAELETTIYRIVQEALTNAAKHSQSQRASVAIVEDASLVQATVRDEGQGFDRNRKNAGFGLAGMQERAALLDGRLTVESAAGQGTTVTATLPARHQGSDPKPSDQPPAARAGEG